MEEEVKFEEEKNELQEVVDETTKTIYKIPKGFYFDEKKQELYRGNKRLSKYPIWITEIIVNEDEDIEKIKVRINKNGKIKEKVIEKAVVYNNPSILANYGVPITKNNSQDYIDYFLEFEQENEVPVINAVSKLGWRKNNKVFVPYSKEENIILDSDLLEKVDIEAIEGSKGTVEEWANIMKKYREQNNLFKFIQDSAFASPLLELVGCRVFGIYNYEKPQSGKSSCFFAAVSAFADPYKKLTLNNTAVGFELRFNFYNHCLAAIQERSIIKSDKELEYLIYLLGEGVGKGRGNVKLQMRPTATWHNIFLLNGEELAFEGNVRKGLFVRCMQIEGSPYNFNMEEAEKMYEIVKSQYGTALPVFIKYLIKEYSGDDYKKLKEEYHQIREQIKIDSKIDKKVNIYYEYLAVMLLADILVNRYIFKEENIEKSYEMIREVSKKIYVEDRDIYKELYETICSWIIKESKYFRRYNLNKHDLPNSKNEFKSDDMEATEFETRSLGVHDERDETFNVFRYLMEEKIKSMGHSYRKVVSEFGKRGYIKTTRSETGEIISNTVQKKYYGINTRFFCFPISKMTEFLSEEEKDILTKQINSEVLQIEIKYQKELEEKRKLDEEAIKEGYFNHEDKKIKEVQKEYEELTSLSKTDEELLKEVIEYQEELERKEKQQ